MNLQQTSETATCNVFRSVCQSPSSLALQPLDSLQFLTRLVLDAAWMLGEWSGGVGRKSTQGNPSHNQPTVKLESSLSYCRLTCEILETGNLVPIRLPIHDGLTACVCWRHPR
jgi:hypothetical protein